MLHGCDVTAHKGHDTNAYITANCYAGNNNQPAKSYILIVVQQMQTHIDFMGWNTVQTFLLLFSAIAPDILKLAYK